MPPRRPREPDIVPSVLDRLLDDEPGQTRESLPYRTDDVRGLKRAVARDLETLLNTRQEALEEIPESFEEVRRSLLTYGLPDFSASSLLSPRDRARIRRALEDAIAAFEPRLERVRITLEESQPTERAMRFKVEGWLRIDPAPEPVAFDTVLQLTTREYVVQGRD
jgi:type VI secretion system protein ImpF